MVHGLAPYPYAQGALLDIPLPFLTNRRLDALLGAWPGERVLEIGPGTGLQALHVARQLGPSGRLDVVDIQQAMLEVGEFFDRHYVPLVTLLRYANASGFEPAMHLGSPVAYLARLRPAPVPAAIC